MKTVYYIEQTIGNYSDLSALFMNETENYIEGNYNTAHLCSVYFLIIKLLKKINRDAL